MQFDRLRRREFITLMGGAAAALPLSARAQQPTKPVVGYLAVGSPGPTRDLVAAFHRGLNETGYSEGRNVAVEYRFAEGQYDRLPAFAREFVARQVDVIVTTGGSPPALAAKAATQTIPIVFSSGADPISTGIVDSLSHPGGNITGASFFTSVLEAKRLELLHEVVPDRELIACLLNPNTGIAQLQSKDLQEAAARLGVRLLLLNARSEAEIDHAFAKLVAERARALLVASDAFFYSRRNQLVTLAARYALPAMYQVREFTAAGGLMSYGTSVAEAYHQAGVYTGRILKGEKPTDLPVVQSTKFEFVINLKTAKALGLDVPLGLTAGADEVIE